jgi:hypothetical protein
MEKEVNVKGTMVDLLTGFDPPKYEKCVILENRRKVLFARLKKALYGTLRAAPLFWKKLTMTIQEWGFTINPYDTSDGITCGNGIWKCLPHGNGVNTW